ncbi:Regulatory protein LEU3 [Cyphellophora attinorum]|uniref:Regulatory protein LEU3 n=1 Tax=Cyphellophora attinorum TaxID=1664694 RepID=A0A0N1H189_9EURO|nr:Regulatory protein LEU3 [Phialophora attinorum]KPI34453.1 Regulatory protein LEU3 [Phialophora attinorum]
MHHVPHESPASNSTNTRPSLTPVNSSSLPPSNNIPTSRNGSIDGFRPSSAGVPPDPVSNAPREQTHPRTLKEVEVTATAVDDCFRLFFTKYAPHMPAVEGPMEPNECYNQSRYLFWTIMTIGSRKYPRDPTLLSQLTPPIVEMTKNAAFAIEKSLHTIQAFMLLCTWPIPHSSIGKDITHVLSGVLLQHALSVGMHIFGVGQDFARIKLTADRSQLYARARLWALCIVVCQRVSCTDGVPPVYIPDNYDHSYCQAQSLNALQPALRFQKTLSRILTESILELERYALSKPMAQRGPVLNPFIDAASLTLADLEPECPADIDRFYLISAELQILSFHLLGPRESLDDAKLARMHSLSCDAIELMNILERNEGFCDHAPLAAMKYLCTAAFTLLKLSRSHMAANVDSERGKAAYFTSISLARKTAVEPEDIMARLAKILTQLWNSKQVFRKSDGTTDPLSLRCGSRLAMSIPYDCFWWWRSEFAGIENPYEDQQANAAHAGVSPESFQNLVWLQESFPEFAWPTMEDLVSMDWPSEPISIPAPSTGSGARSSGPMPEMNSIWM